jgi:hypothetical protein
MSDEREISDVIFFARTKTGKVFFRDADSHVASAARISLVQARTRFACATFASLRDRSRVLYYVHAHPFVCVARLSRSAHAMPLRSPLAFTIFM